MAPATEAAPSPLLARFPFRLLATHASDWTPERARVTLNARMDARLVPSPASPDGVRLAYAHLVVLDGLVEEAQRAALLDHLTAPGWDHTQGPPPERWERETADGVGAARTWGLRNGVLSALAERPPAAVLEVQSRLAALYPEYAIAHMPSEHMQAGSLLPQECACDEDGRGGVHAADLERDGKDAQRARASDDDAAQPEGLSRAGDGAQGSAAHLSEAAVSAAAAEGPDAAEEAAEEQARVFCAQFVGNAPVAGDQYKWHVDADPAALSRSAWTAAFGRFCNGEPGRPLLVSLLLYLCDAWPRDWAAETLFLDAETEVGVVVRPKRYRAVLMDQDMLHRVSAPALAAGGRPRYSLVWKLAFLPRRTGQRVCIARREWGTPASIGSAQGVDLLMRQMSAQGHAG